MSTGHDLPQPTEIRVSVIMPAYNAEQTVARAIESALAQTEPRCEVLVIDDATADIVARIAEQDRRVHLLRNTTNRGPAGARNDGLAVARGDWIALLDADDTFAPHRVATLKALGELHNADIVADNLLLCPEDNPAQCNTASH